MARPAFFFGPAGPLGCQLRGPPRRRTARSATASLASCAKGMAGPRGPIKGPKKCLFPGNRPPGEGFRGFSGYFSGVPFFRLFSLVLEAGLGPGAPGTSICTKNQPRRPVPRPFRVFFFLWKVFGLFLDPAGLFVWPGRPGWEARGATRPPPGGFLTPKTVIGVSLIPKTVIEVSFTPETVIGVSLTPKDNLVGGF